MPRRIADRNRLEQGFSCGLLAGLLACGGGGGGSKQVLTLTSTPKTAGIEAHPYRYTITATSPQSSSLVFTLVSGPTGAALTGATVEWTPAAAQAGASNAFTIRATDGATTLDQSWSVAVSVNGVPSFTSTPPASAKEGHAYAYDLSASDPDGDSVQFTSVQLPAGASLTGTRLTWTPGSAAVGQVASFKVDALDGFGGTHQQTWEVTPSANSLPLITSQPPADVSFLQGAPVFDYTLAGTDADGDTLTYTLVQGPAGATLANGVLHWLPTPSQERVAQTFQIRLSDGHGGTTEQSWTKAYSGVLRGSWADVYQSASGAVATRADAFVSTFSLRALVPDGSGGFRTIMGTLNPNGSLAISGIPPGGYWVALGPRGYYWTNQGTLDLGQRFQGRADADANATGAPLIMNLTNLESWSDLNALVWQVPNLGVQSQITSSWFTAHGPLAGDTLLASATMPHIPFTPLVDAAKADSLNLHQLSTSNQGWFYTSSIGRTFASASLTESSSQASTLNGAFAVPPGTSVDLDWDGQHDAGLKAQVRPDAVAAGGLLQVVVQPGGLANGLLQKPYSELDQNTAAPMLLSASANPIVHYQQPLTFKDPYAATWPRIFVTTTQFLYSLNLNGSRGQSIAYISTLSDTPGTAATPLKALVGPVQHPTINGQSLSLDLTGVGTTPTLAWDPPVLGTAVCYQVRFLVPQDGGGGVGITQNFSQNLTVFGTSVQVPPGILTPGTPYLILVRAVAAGTGYDPAVPHRFPLPVGLADCVSGVIRP